MSSLPLVNVTARIKDQQGRPVSGAVVKMRLTTVEKYQGIIVPRETMQVTDAAGVAILRVFPNALGYEGSEYDVHITFPGANSGVCGSIAPSTPALRAIRAHAVVPNVDCNLLDILNLPPYEQRGAGSVLPQEVAGYAAEAASHADAARSSAQAAEASKGAIIALTDATEAAKSAAQASAKEAATHAQQTKNSADRVDEIVCDFENTVIEKTEKTAQRLMAKATSCIKEQEVVSLNAIEQRSADVMLDFTTAATEARAGAVTAILESKENALHAVDDAKLSALDDLQEVGAEYEEDFVALVERAEGAAKRAGCSSAGAANSAAKACACAEDAKTAAQGLERSKEDALDAARRAETAASCASADAQRAETAADGVKANAESAKQSAVAAQKNAQAADASAELAKCNADSAKQSAADAADDKAEVEGIADDVKKAVLDTAATIVSEEIIDKATAQATAEANAARDTAVASKTAAESAKTDAEAAKADAESARDAADASATDAKGHADRAKSVVDNLDVSIDDAVPKPLWEGTKLGFKNTLATVDVPPVELKGEKGDKGDSGDKGDKGDIGDTGNAATIAVGTVTTLAAGSTPTITNTGTPHAAVLDFAIPQGEKGDTPNVSIIAGTGLSGGGDLTADLTLSVAYGDSADTACAGDDARLSDARTPTPHTASHMHGGNDEIATTAPAANAIPKAGADGKISKGWLPDSVGGGATVVSTPVIALGDFVPIGMQTEFTVTAAPLLSGGRTIASFAYSISELALHEVVAATENSASVSFTVPEDTAVDAEFTVVVSAVDDMGNASADATKNVHAEAAFVNAPTLDSPVAGAEIFANTLVFSTAAFAVTGTTDTHLASQYRLRAADGTTAYDSGEVSDLLTLTADVSEVLAEDVEYVAEARHKGSKLGWSAWGESGGFMILLPRVAQPTIISPVADSTVYNSVTVATSPFATLGAADTHESTDWFLTSDVAGKIIVAQALASTNKLSYTFTGLTVADGQTLYAWAVHKGTVLGKSAKSAGVGFVAKLGLFIAVGSETGLDGATSISVDGMTWAKSIKVPDSNSGWLGIAHGNGKFITVGNADKAATSADGVTWENLVNISGQNTIWYGVAYGNGIWAAGGALGSLATSTNGITWKTVYPIADYAGAWKSIVYGNGRFVVVGDGNKTLTSTDGLTWTVVEISKPSGPSWNSVVYGNGKFVAVNASRGISTSIDGLTWTRVVQDEDYGTGAWYGVAYGNGRFVAVGGNGSVSSSANGVTWTNRTVITGQTSHTYKLTYGSGKFVAIGGNVKSSTSIDGLTWEAGGYLGGNDGPQTGNWQGLVGI